ncbi:putative hydrolase [Butyrivibrio sp. INlla18]|uniref:phosphatase n=1 Tax=Butyrivibrio sp. INlla18 TaxID=1520806 RepID=UPI0008897D78|nr:phosphatase [Butyrivibrio sp. INlla18]SDA58357.1 putative hydrolase [Butyrivibrio sp. INlla18]
MYHIECDTHTHTIYSRHAYSTIEENVRAASEKGIKLLGSTDHFSEMLFPDYKDVKNYQYFFGTNMWPRQFHGVTLLRGCEADIVDMEGHMFGFDNIITKSIVGDEMESPMPLIDMVFRRMDYVIASVHSKRHTVGHSAAENTQMFINALSHPKVLFIGHIGRSGVEFEMDPVLKAAKDMNKALEINEASFSYEGHHQSLCRQVAVRCAELGVKIAVNTDAHMAYEIGNASKALAMLEDIHFPEELIITRTRESFLEALRASGVFTDNIIK